MLTTYYNWFLIAMTAIGLVVFIALYFVKAGYGIFLDKKWGAAIPNRLGWIIMEAPVFIAMCFLWYYSDRRWEPVRFCFFFLFQLICPCETRVGKGMDFLIVL